MKGEIQANYVKIMDEVRNLTKSTLSLSSSDYEFVS